MMLSWKPSSSSPNKYEVRIIRLKLEMGVFAATVLDNEALAIDVVAKRTSSKPYSCLRLPFFRKSEPQCAYTTGRRPLRRLPTHAQDAPDLRDFLVVLKGDSEMEFQVLYEEGRVSMKLRMAELQGKEFMEMESKLPMELRVDGLTIQAFLPLGMKCCFHAWWWKTTIILNDTRVEI